MLSCLFPTLPSEEIPLISTRNTMSQDNKRQSASLQLMPPMFSSPSDMFSTWLLVTPSEHVKDNATVTLPESSTPFNETTYIRLYSCLFAIWMYSRTPLIRPPSESHWCGRIRGMVAREGFVYEQKPLSVTRNVIVRVGWSLVRVVVRQGFYCSSSNSIGADNISLCIVIPFQKAMNK